MYKAVKKEHYLPEKRYLPGVTPVQQICPPPSPAIFLFQMVTDICNVTQKL